MAKSRVSPIKNIVSIPRLELQAAVLGSRLAVTIKENHSLNIHKCFYWTDSKTVAGWIKANPTIFKPFVAHRVSEIVENTDAREWNWISTKENVADDATRENYQNEWKTGGRWLEGPPFLKNKTEEWPQYQIPDFDTSENKKCFVGVTVKVNLTEALPKITRFSRWLKLIRTTAWMLRFLQQVKKKSPIDGELTTSEVEIAEKLWIRCVQSEDFSEEFQSLKSSGMVESYSKLSKLSPILDHEDIIRVRSRIIYSNDLTDDAKFPIILEPKNYFTKLLIRYYHNKAAHSGQEFVANELRQRYWILNMRSAVRNSWTECQFCKNRRAKPEIPEMAPLPESRLGSFVRPFTTTGMDYFGPMQVSIGRRREKRYGVLFTCMSTRAVHLEIAHSLTTDSAIMAIRRLIGRRGCPKRIFSDNGTNLRGAERELKNAIENFDQNRMTSSMTTNNIEFNFIPPSAPHMGGSWERLVKSIKITLSIILKDKSPQEEVLQTLLIEAESLVNSRPLVHVSLDNADSEVLTPNHFLIGTSSAAQIPGKFDENDLVTRKQWRKSQLLADHFWRRWIKEYLPVLTKRTKWFSSSKRKIGIGDVVIIIDSQFSRNTWPKGIVTAVYPGADGNIRVVDVKTTIGTYRRPLTKLCLLDLEGNYEKK
ncbi:uncharacterized protein LOC123314055 [Coccinella septempunctata]|uniref:uncharacterized protein LOC123314055 n=1 Tax=Coccinella septempunctata TaxID=41139 RepID=UPI001D074556|nr:uncharacterized protein LOC123314055 [Coccinella septempunctata]